MLVLPGRQDGQVMIAVQAHRDGWVAGPLCYDLQQRAWNDRVMRIQPNYRRTYFSFAAALPFFLGRLSPSDYLKIEQSLQKPTKGRRKTPKQNSEGCVQHESLHDVSFW